VRLISYLPTWVLSNFLNPPFLYLLIEAFIHQPITLIYSGLCLICSGLSWGFFFWLPLPQRVETFLHQCKTLGGNCLAWLGLNLKCVCVCVCVQNPLRLQMYSLGCFVYQIHFAFNLLIDVTQYYLSLMILLAPRQGYSV
jgi:hypothetical protein